MKKYVTPALEVIEIFDRSQLVCNTQTPIADAKENEIFFEEEGDDPWDTDPWGTEYDLWNEGD
jgi:hypothetical protein